MTDEPASPNGRERVGVILVHGIGEQRRFEHLDGQGRELIEALIKQPDREVTVAIDGGAASAFLAEQASWNSGPNGPVHVFVKDTKTSEVTHEIHFHEIWWADINESYSMAKQFRLWLWGLSAWLYPRGPNRPMRGQQQGDIILPVVPGLTESDHKLRQRAQLFLVGVLFAVAALPLGFGLALWLRLVNARSPDFLRTVTNYVSGVKLFNQKTRWGPSIFPVKDDFLDTLGDPPRVSVRRRVVRAYAEMALANYDRWYIVAHSQGTVAAFNGLMEPPYAWPGYFDEAGWERLRRAGLGAFCGFPDPAGHQMPRRPVWSGPEEGARRDKIFERLHGIITLGSPIEKFAAIWPARVPICLLPAFSAKTFWLNFFDPLDPVSGRLTAYQIHREAACPPPQDLGYAASPFFFLAHIRYLAWTGQNCLADRLADMVLTGQSGAFDGWVRELSPKTIRERSREAKLWWLGVFSLFSILAGLTLTGLIGTSLIPMTWQVVEALVGWTVVAVVGAVILTGAAGLCTFYTSNKVDDLPD